VGNIDEDLFSSDQNIKKM